MKRGRRPTPTSLRLLHGNPGRRPIGRELIAPGDLAAPPAWFTPEQRKTWRYAVRHAPLGLLKRLDRGVLAVWVVAENTHRQAVMAQAGALLVSGQQSPLLSIINRQALIMLKAAANLGFTPTSRPHAQGGMRPVM